MGIGKVEEVQEDLIHRFIAVGRKVEDHSGLGKEEDGHHQRIIPELAFVFQFGVLMLQAVFRGAGHRMKDPITPLQHDGLIAFFRSMGMKKCEGKQRSYGVDGFLGKTEGDPLIEPCLEVIENRFVFVHQVMLINSVKPDPVRPIPYSKTLCFDFGLAQPKQVFDIRPIRLIQEGL